jgi:hypothetical protein
MKCSKELTLLAAYDIHNMKASYYLKQTAFLPYIKPHLSVVISRILRAFKTPTLFIRKNKSVISVGILKHNLQNIV